MNGLVEGSEGARYERGDVVNHGSHSVNVPREDEERDEEVHEAAGHDERNGGNAGNLYHFDKKLPVHAVGSFLVLAAVLAETTAHFAHLLETVTAVEEVFDVLGHNLSDILEFIVQLVEVLCGARVLVRLLGLLDEGVELDVGIWATGRRKVLLRWVGSSKLLGKV